MAMGGGAQVGSAGRGLGAKAAWKFSGLIMERRSVPDDQPN